MSENIPGLSPLDTAPFSDAFLAMVPALVGAFGLRSRVEGDRETSEPYEGTGGEPSPRTMHEHLARVTMRRHESRTR